MAGADNRFITKKSTLWSLDRFKENLKVIVIFDAFTGNFQTSNFINYLRISNKLGRFGFFIDELSEIIKIFEVSA